MAPDNTREYWDMRFRTGDWSEHGGSDQTRKYALSLVRHWALPSDFYGTILDFGCALGDAIPVYKAALPKARFIGLDHSHDAISICRETLGDIAEFRQGDHNDVPEVDVIVASHILEHIDDDLKIVEVLLTKCKELYITVPYREYPLFREHVRSYDEFRYDELAQCEWCVYVGAGYDLTWRNIYQVHLKNILRPLLGRKLVKPAKAIMYRFGRHDG